jgi:hypothetical protein
VSCPELTDLGGLEGLEGLTGVSVQNNAKLTSLRGIQIPEAMDRLEVWDSPVSDLGDVSRLTDVRFSLWFNHTALESAVGLERVARVDHLQFWGNPVLRDLSALSALQRLSYLTLDENPELEIPPVLDGVRSLTSLSLRDNAALRELPRIPVTSLQEVSIQSNASLERILAWSETRRVYQLRVADNPQLSALDLGGLQDLSEVWVTNNPALDDSALRRLEGLGVGRVRIAGNLGQTLPLVQCPWTGEGFCDDMAQHPYGLCAPGTDPDCVLSE